MQTKRITRPLKIVELKAAVEFAPTTYYDPGDENREPVDRAKREWRHLKVQVRKLEDGWWRIRTLALVSQNDGDPHLLVGNDANFEIMTQRGEPKRYKSWDAIREDMFEVVGRRGTVHIFAEAAPYVYPQNRE